jgi:hypothetical protein
VAVAAQFSHGAFDRVALAAIHEHTSAGLRKSLRNGKANSSSGPGY